MIYIKANDNKVSDIVSCKDCPSGYTSYPDSAEFYLGDDVRFFSDQGVRLTVAKATEAGLITVGNNETAVWEDGKYTVTADYTQKKYWIKATGEHKPFSLGERPDATMTDQEPPHPEAEWQTDQWVIPSTVKAREARERRDQLLSDCDYLMMSDYPATKKAAWKTYRKSLRDVPKQAGFPDSIHWPTKP